VVVGDAQSFIKNLFIQKVLAQPHWLDKMTRRDNAALTPRSWVHVNPYGRFEPDMNTRLDLPCSKWQPVTRLFQRVVIGDIAETGDRLKTAFRYAAPASTADRRVRAPRRR